jgi:hypothetical protein
MSDINSTFFKVIPGPERTGLFQKQQQITQWEIRMVSITTTLVGPSGNCGSVFKSLIIVFSLQHALEGLRDTCSAYHEPAGICTYGECLDISSTSFLQGAFITGKCNPLKSIYLNI